MGPLDEAVPGPARCLTWERTGGRGFIAATAAVTARKMGELSKGLNYQKAALVVTWISCSRRGFVFCFFFFSPIFQMRRGPRETQRSRTKRHPHLIHPSKRSV